MTYSGFASSDGLAAGAPTFGNAATSSPQRKRVRNELARAAGETLDCGLVSRLKSRNREQYHAFSTRPV